VGTARRGRLDGRALRQSPPRLGLAETAQRR
jgi:hypothetical protein